ncbi:MAG: hypothetical protein HY900_01725 [Deltaproteobacteria bacterium]|nr:hypothetical protein [Deltaproteobacteria bacterium]
MMRGILTNDKLEAARTGIAHTVPYLLSDAEAQLNYAFGELIAPGGGAELRVRRLRIETPISWRRTGDSIAGGVL